MTIFISVADKAFYANLPNYTYEQCSADPTLCSYPASEFETHLMTIDLPLSGIQLAVSIAVIYILVILSRITTNMTDKDDPFSNVYLIALIVLFVDSQRMVFKVIDLIFMAERSGAVEPILKYPRALFNEMVVTRYATMSMELLFIIIPIRHNLLIH